MENKLLIPNIDISQIDMVILENSHNK
jgi:hypothetical protein